MYSRDKTAEGERSGTVAEVNKVVGLGARESEVSTEYTVCDWFSGASAL